MKVDHDQLDKHCIEEQLVQVDTHKLTEVVANAVRALPRLFADRNAMVMMVIRPQDDENAVVLLTCRLGLDYPAWTVFHLLQEKVSVYGPAWRLGRSAKSRVPEIFDAVVVFKPNRHEVAVAAAYIKERFGAEFLEELEQALDELVPFGLVEPRQND